MGIESASAAGLTRLSRDGSTAARVWVEYTPDPGDIGEPSGISGAPRGVMTDDGGTVTMEDALGTEIVVTFAAFTILPFSPTKITASTATTVYLIY